MMFQIILDCFSKRQNTFFLQPKLRHLACYSYVTPSCILKDQKPELKSSTNLQQAEASQSKMILRSNSTKCSSFNESKGYLQHLDWEGHSFLISSRILFLLRNFVRISEKNIIKPSFQSPANIKAGSCFPAPC